MSSPNSRTQRTVGQAWTAATLCLAASLASAQMEVSVSPTPVGSGARAAGMADAFVAIADDATAASWNPAGLVQLERPEISLVGSWNYIDETFDADLHDEVHSNQHSDRLDLNYFSFAYPLPFLVADRNVCLSLNYQRKYDFTREFKLQYNMANYTTGGGLSFLDMDFEQQGGLSALTPAIAIEVTPRLSVGAAFNFWRPCFLSDNRWEQTSTYSIFNKFGQTNNIAYGKYKEVYDGFEGENTTLGLLWSVNDRWSMGLRYDTSFMGTSDYRSVLTSWQETLPTVSWPDTRVTGRSTPKQEKRRLRFPATLAVGAACRFNDRLTVSMDLTRTDWNDFYYVDTAGNKVSLVDARNQENPFARCHFEPTTTVRLGTEYVFVPKQPDEELKTLWTLRGGLFYDEEPASQRPSLSIVAGNGSGHPDSFYGFALGAGLLTHQRVNIDLAYQARFGSGVNGDFLLGVNGFREDMVQHRVLLSAVIYF